MSRDGELLVEPMKGTWFNRGFPKETGKRPNNPSVPRTRRAEPAPAARAEDRSEPSPRTAVTASTDVEPRGPLLRAPWIPRLRRMGNLIPNTGQSPV